MKLIASSVDGGVAVTGKSNGKGVLRFGISTTDTSGERGSTSTSTFISIFRISVTAIIVIFNVL